MLDAGDTDLIYEAENTMGDHRQGENVFFFGAVEVSSCKAWRHI